MILKLLAVPFVALAPTLLIVTVLGTIHNTQELHQMLGGNSALPVWQASTTALYMLMFVGHYIKK